jgi:hypothetical protein
VPYRQISTPSQLVAKHGCTYRRDFPRQLNILGHAHLALVERALEVCLANRLAAVCLLIDQSDQAVLYLEVHLKAFLDLVLEVAARLDAELLATAVTSVHTRYNLSCMNLHALRWRARKQTYGFGGFGSKSTFSIFRMSSAGSPQK